MRQDVIDLVQTAIWDGIGEEVEVFAPARTSRLTYRSGWGRRSGPSPSRRRCPAVEP